MGLRTRARGTTALVGALVVTLLGGACASPDSAETVASPSAPLRILLVNDDGWEAPGVTMLRNRLREAGHRVVQVAPEVDVSDSGTGATLGAPFRVWRPTPDPDLWVVAGSAADAALVGLRSVMGNEWPDVVVSGIDPRRTVGLDSVRSGTVGAAMTASGLDFPSVAVSADLDVPEPAPADFDRAADFTVRLLATMQRQQPDGARLMPRHTVLNVNYPRGPEPARGVIAVPTADVPATTLFYRYEGDLETYVAAPTPAPAPGGRDGDSGSDMAALAGGRVTLTDLSADPDRSAPPPRVAVPLADQLTP